MQITVTLRIQDFNSKQVKVPACQETKLQWARQTQLNDWVRRLQLTEDTVQESSGWGRSTEEAWCRHWLLSFYCCKAHDHRL